MLFVRLWRKVATAWTRVQYMEFVGGLLKSMQAEFEYLYTNILVLVLVVVTMVMDFSLFWKRVFTPR